MISHQLGVFYNQTSRLQPSEILSVRLVSADLHFHPTAQDVAWKLLERAYAACRCLKGWIETKSAISLSLMESRRLWKRSKQQRNAIHVTSSMFLPSFLMDSENWAR